MLAFRPMKRARLGQLSRYTGGITADLAQKIVEAADPATRRIIRDERNRAAEALLGGIPFGAISALAYVGTRYLVPDGAKTAKAVGYGASALALAIGSWWTFAHLTETTAPEPVSEEKGGLVSDVAVQAAKEIVREAEPRIRKIVDEEKARAVEAAQAGLPFAIGAVGTFLATMFLTKPTDTLMKAIGYSATALLLGAGAWVALDKEIDAMTPTIPPVPLAA